MGVTHDLSWEEKPICRMAKSGVIKIPIGLNDE